MDEISPPPQPDTGIAGGQMWRSKEALAGYHIGPDWPSACGTSPIFMHYRNYIGSISYVFEIIIKMLLEEKDILLGKRWVSETTH
jgi:hypothetical protein